MKNNTGVISGEVLIRPLTADESGSIAVVNKLMQQLKPGIGAVSESELRAALQDEWHFKLFIAEDKTKKWSEAIVGMTSIVRFYKLSGARMEIHEVVVDDAYRGRGIGEALVKRVIAYAQDEANASKKIVKVQLTSKPDRVAGNALYKKIGFELIAKADGENGTNLYQLKMQPE